MSPPLLVATRVGKVFAASAVAAVEDVSLTIEAGTVTEIVGESGSGKTTLARIMAGLLRPSGGEVTFDGTKLGSLRTARLRHLRQHLQYVHQDPASALDPRMRVKNILHEPLVIHTRLRRAQRQARILQLLEAVALPATLMDRFPHQLSGGQQRRVGLARILILRPRLVILDEPTAGLDLLVQASLLALLGKLRAQLSLTYVVVTHDLTVVEALCPSVLVMFRGRIVEQGETKAVLRAPRHPYTQELLSALPRLDGPRVINQARWDAEAFRAERPAEGCPFRPRCAFAVVRCAQEAPDLVSRAGRQVACWAVSTG